MQLWLAIWWMLWAAPAQAADVSTHLDSRSLRVGQSVGLRVVVIDARTVEPPVFPELQGLQITSQGAEKSSVMVNFRTTRTVTFNYALTALAPGDYEVRPAPMLIDGDRALVPPVSLQVKPRAEGDEAEADTLFTTLGTEEIWVGEVVVHHLEFRTRKRLLDSRWQPPSFEGFVPDQLAEAVQREYPVLEDGVNWTVLEVDSPLVATGVGSREIPAGVFRAQFAVTRQTARRRGFGVTRFADAKTEVLPTRPLPVKVRPLPEEGQSPEFSGLVGHFEVRARLDTDEVVLGESATLTVHVSGDGSLAGFALPEVPADAGFRAYDDEPEIHGEVRGGRYESVGTWRRAIVPEAVAGGLLELPPVSFQVFDPTEGVYATVSSQPLQLRVLPGDAAATEVAELEVDERDRRREVEALGDDILPIHPRARLRSQVFSPTAPGLLALVGLPLLAWGGLLGRDVLRGRRPRRDPVRELRRRLAAARQEPPDLAGLEDLFREALGVALGRPAAGLDRAAVQTGFTSELREAVLALYADLDRARYGGGVGEGLRERVFGVVEQLLGRRR